MKESSVQGQRKKFCTRAKKKRTGSYKAARPKNKKREKKLAIAISPKVECSLLSWLSLSTHKAELLFEISLPTGKAELCIVKDESISCCPDDPTGSYEDFSKDRVPKNCSSFNDHV
jgi:hypothetical protein